MELSGRVAIVTGAAKGMGRDITLALAREGADVALVGRDLDAIGPVEAEVKALGRRAITIGCDVTQPSAVEAMAAQTRSTLGGRIDILVNVAGGTGPLERDLLGTTPEEWDQIMDLNAKGCFLTMRAVLPTMVQQGYGKICNVGGTFGMRGRALRLAYSSSKWALRGLSKSAALEYGQHNININCVAPGMTDGPRFDRVCAEKAKTLGVSKAEARKVFEREYALRRISQGEDVAHAVLFLVSERSRQITGVDLPVDGGWASL
jgi:3-oxoacyl-[acyl-carrier protein] reductase